jgi:sugar phosphate isomerase/epimerase
MRLGIFTVSFRDRPLAEVLPELAALGIESVELGTGNYPGSEHCPPDKLLDNPGAQSALLELVDANGMTISALSQQGNPLHPHHEIAAASHEVWRKTVKLAAQLGVRVVNAFSGCPGDRDGSRYPNWVTCAWPPEFVELRRWQWQEKVLPYWREEAKYAASEGIDVAIEMHPGFVVYNPTTLLELRAGAGGNIGVNFDPSHLFWQGVDPVEAIAMLAAEGAIYHVHAKDTELRAETILRKGVLDVEPLAHVADRSWSFRAIGLGHDPAVWQEIVSALARGGYDHVISIEHEDELLETDEAITKSIEVLKPIIASVRQETVVPKGGEPNE